MIVTSFVMFSANNHVHAALPAVAYGNGTPADMASLDVGTVFPIKTITEGGRFYFTHTNDHNTTISVENIGDITNGRYKNAGGTQTTNQAATQIKYSWADGGRYLYINRPKTETEGWAFSLEGNASSCVTSFVFVAPATGYYSFKATYSNYYEKAYKMYVNKTGSTTPLAQTNVTAADSDTWQTVAVNEVYLKYGEELIFVHDTEYWNHSGSFKEFEVKYVKRSTPNTEGPLAFGNGTAPTVTTLAAGTKFPINTISNGGNFYFIQNNDYDNAGTPDKQGFFVSNVGAVTNASGVDANGAIIRNQAANQIKWTWGESKGTNRWMALNINEATDPTWAVNIEGNASTCVLQFVFVAPVDGYYSVAAEFIKRYPSSSQTHSIIVSIEKGASTLASKEVENSNTAMNSVAKDEILLAAGDELIIKWNSNGYMDNPTVFKTLDVTFDGCETCDYENGECTVCGAECDHANCTKTYTHDANGHVATWTCGEVDTTDTAHRFVNGVCACTYACDHANCTKTYTHDANGHVATWTCGKVDTTDTAHDFTNGNCVCGEAKPVHTHDNCTKTYTNNGDEHVAEWSCGEVDANDTEHDFTNGNCVCGAKKPAPQTGDTATSISIALAAMAITGFAIFTKKRKH